MEAEKNKNFAVLRKIVAEDKSALRDLINLQEISLGADIDERKLIREQERAILRKMEKISSSISPILAKIIITKKIESRKNEQVAEKTFEKKESASIEIPRERKSFSFFKIGSKEGLDDLERLTLDRIKKRMKYKEKIKSEFEESLRPSRYAKFSNMMFGNISNKLAEGDGFRSLKRDLVKAKIMHLPKSYISLMLFSTMMAFFASLMVFSFFLFFNLSFSFPFLFGVREDLITRLTKIFWIPIFFPVATYFLMYVYPSLEAKSAEGRINFELPFATINMAAISNSMIEPSKIFEIIVSTKEYPYLEREFMRLNNSINVYGYDLVSALRNVAFTSPSKKLSELLNGLATTITSGGDLPKFFEKRAETLLFDYRLEREKSIKSSETFMDIYISVVIAAPMILMLLLMMLKISGLGVGFSTSTITLVMALGVTGINIVFLTFLHLKQPNQ